MALKDRVDLISIMVLLEVVANIVKIIFYCFWIKHNLVIRPNHECERGCEVLVEHISVFYALCRTHICMLYQGRY